MLCGYVGNNLTFLPLLKELSPSAGCAALSLNYREITLRSLTGSSPWVCSLRFDFCLLPRKAPNVRWATVTFWPGTLGYYLVLLFLREFQASSYSSIYPEMKYIGVILKIMNLCTFNAFILGSQSLCLTKLCRNENCKNCADHLCRFTQGSNDCSK